MFLSMQGEPSEADGFLFMLAEKLGKSVAEIVQLPAWEIVQWRSYLTVKGALENMAGRAAANGQKL